MGYLSKPVENTGLFINFSWERTSYSVIDNTSTVQWDLALVSLSSQTITSTEPTEWEVIINGEAYNGTNTVTIGAATSKILASGTTVIPHNPDRTKTFSFSFVQTFNTLGVDFVTGSGSSKLDPIPVQATITSATNFTDDDNPVITYSNPSGEAIESLQACIAHENGSSIFVGYRDISKTDTSYTFNLTDSERSQLRAASANSLTYPVRFYVKSVIDGVTYHSYSGVKTLTIKTTGPTVTASVLDTNSTTFNLTGDSNKMIRDFNAMLCQMTATGQKGAAVTSYSITCGEHSSTSDSVVFNNVSDNTFVFKATDSRGLVTTKTITLPMINYVKPTCVQKVEMLMSTATSAQATITLTGTYFEGNFGAASNSITIETRNRLVGGSWTAWGDITVLATDIRNGTYSLSADISNLDVTSAYEFQSRVKDKVTAVESVVGSVTMKPVFDWGKTDFNFNVPVAMQKSLTVEGNLTVGGILTVEGSSFLTEDSLGDYVISTGTASMGSNGTWYWSKWKSGKAECYGVRNYGNMGVSTAWGGLYRSDIFSQSLPSGLFASTPQVIDITYRGSNFGGWIARHEEFEADSATTGGFILVRPASATLSQVYFGFNVIGRWK